MVSSNKTVDYVHLYYTDNITICSDSGITCALLWPSFMDAKKTEYDYGEARVVM